MQAIIMTNGVEPFHIHWGNLPGASPAWAIAQLAQEQNRPLLLLCSNEQQAEQWSQAIQFFAAPEISLRRLPSHETLPYDYFSPSESITSERLATLYHLPGLQKGIVVSTITTAMQRLMPKSALFARALLLKIGQSLSLTSFKTTLIENGYRLTSQVMEHGEFTVRGSLMDIFPMGSNKAYRIELFDDVIESLRTIDLDTQCSIEKISSVELLPTHEYGLDEISITHFRQAWRSLFSGNPTQAPLYEAVSDGHAAPGLEYYFPLFYDQCETIHDYLPFNTLCILESQAYESAQVYQKEILRRYEQLRHNRERPLLNPSAVFLTPESLYQSLKPYSTITLHTDPIPAKASAISWAMQRAPELPIHHQASSPLEPVQQWLKQYTGKVLFCAESEGRRESLLELFSHHSISLNTLQSWKEGQDKQQGVYLLKAPLTEGFIDEDHHFAVITEKELFGEQVKIATHYKHHEIDPNTVIKSLTELKMGDPIVHLDYGVGRYQGLQKIETQGIETEYMLITYANNDKIYVPIASLHLVTRYTGLDAEHAPLHYLGTKTWKKEKEAAEKRIRDVAAELLHVYSQRKIAPGFAFKKPDDDFQVFRNEFPYEETLDQTKAIDAVIGDMIRPHPMDRLVCGDVGFGKTEIAMQAAFLAVQSGKQVAMLVPTTLLASQHYTSFKDRFAHWPIKISLLSRFVDTTELNKTKEFIESGHIDIVIGTHKLIQRDIIFKNLGLLIVDEEHRFGVRQKERMKALRENVDVLTLTATPIPRTLNLSLSGLRDLSIIATPPLRRLPIKTFVYDYNEIIIKEAILREMMRGGQIYFLHNEVRTIDQKARELQQLLPQIKIGVAHGQMKEKSLEKVMLDFYHQRFHVLVCSTIIESGIDIPSTNTIIINHANKFGLAQLHQLRGRVGRSHHQAYAYLLVSSLKALRKDAERRLEAITELEELGAGFLLATHDLEIRGAGEILGEDQSGHIHTIGFSLYMELLNEAIQSLRDHKEITLLERPEEVVIELNQSALLPEKYVHDVGLRLTLYKRLSSCASLKALEEFKTELIDRFGLLPVPTQRLFKIAHLKLLAKSVGIIEIRGHASMATITFNRTPRINTDRLLKLIHTKPDEIKLKGAEKLSIHIPKDQEPADCLENLLQLIAS